LELSQYEEVEHFTRFGTEVDEATSRQIEKGKRILSVLKQKPNQPFSFPMTVIILYALNHGYLDDVIPEEIGDYQEQLGTSVFQKELKLLNEIETEGQLTDSITQQMNKVLKMFHEDWFEKRGDVL
jgi:F-type H+-transporting ATPase subunit alpha